MPGRQVPAAVLSSSSKVDLLTNWSTDSKAAHVSAIKPQVKPQIPWINPPTPEHLLGQVRKSPYIPNGTSNQAHRLIQRSGVATYLAAVPQFCAIPRTWRCSLNTAPHIIYSGMQLACAHTSVRICIVLLMQLHLLLTIFSPMENLLSIHARWFPQRFIMWCFGW